MFCYYIKKVSNNSILQSILSTPQFNTWADSVVHLVYPELQITVSFQSVLLNSPIPTGSGKSQSKTALVK